jgi:hypothetical protein
MGKKSIARHELSPSNRLPHLRMRVRVECPRRGPGAVRLLRRRPAGLRGGAHLRSRPVWLLHPGSPTTFIRFTGAGTKVSSGITDRIASAARGRSQLDFYAAARQAFAVVRTSDPGPYGCFILRKGVV